MTERTPEQERDELLLRERRQRETAETLAAAYLALARSHELGSILDTLLEYLHRLVPSDSSMVLLLGEDSILSVGALRGQELWRDPVFAPRVTFDIRRNQLLADILGQRRPVVLADVLDDPRWEHVAEGAPVRGWLGVPLIIQDKAIGLYSLDKAEPGYFTDEHVRMAESLAPAAASAIEIARLLRDIREAAEFSQQIIASAQDGVAVLDRDLRYRVWNDAIAKIAGCPASEVIGRTRAEVFPQVADQGIGEMERRALAGEPSTPPDLAATTSDGRNIWASVRLSPLKGASGEIAGVIAVVRDVTEARRRDALRDERNRILESIAANAPLDQSLTALARLVEADVPGALCTIMLLDEDGLHLRHGAAPGFSEEFVTAIDGLGIGPAAGACGTAMHRREPVVSSDVLSDPLWADYRHLAALGGVRSCWSTPILSNEGRVLGSFAVYGRGPHAPADRDRAVVDAATAVAGIAIQRSRADQTLRRSAARLKAVVDGALDAVVSIDAQGRVVSWNPRAELVFGWSSGEAVGRRLADLVIPASQREAHREGLARYLATRSPVMVGRRLEMNALRRDGTEFPIEMNIVATEDAAGVVFTAFIDDIAERRQAAQRLADSEERLRQIAENIREVFWITDPLKTRMLYISPAYEEIWGRSCESLYAHPMSFVEAIHPEDRGGVLARMTSQASGEYDEVYRILRPDGSLRWIHDRAFPVRGPGGEVVRVVGSAQDVTDLKRAEEALRSSEERYRSLFESAPDGIFVADPDGAFVDVNPSGLRMLGYSREELVGRTRAEILEPREPGPQAAAPAEGDGAQGRERQLRRRDGTVFQADVLGTVMTDGRSLSLVRDVSEHKRMEEQLRQSQKMEAVGRLAGGIAHDFNNILGVITGHGELLRTAAAARAPELRRIEQIVRAAERGAGLTRQLLAFSRKQVMQPRVLVPSTVVTEMRRFLEPLIGEDVDLVLRADASGRVKVDPGQLEQVVMNLVVNARDAMPTGGTLVVTTSDLDVGREDLLRLRVDLRPGPYVQLAVTDTGVGMDQATQARVFEPFFTTKPEGKGTGLGLSTVYGIVTQSGGAIGLASAPGKGTTFRVYLPRVEAALTPEDGRSPARPRTPTETILVVEDEPAARELVAEILREQGYTVLLAANGREAIEAARGVEGPLQLLLTDVVLPKLGGREAAERIRVFRPGIKVLFMSGYSDDEVSRHGVLEPGILLLQKPFTPDDLTRRVAEVLEAP